ncbi:MAG: hypothetical protein KF767_09740 [Bdellovibrionaceae bacterium]|nr:hypothetical protein [Pseudobdellovibrionaceae bacterium]
MPSRKLMIQIHLVIAALFLPLMLMMPLTGTLYIWGFKGSDEKVEAFRASGPVPEGKEEQEAFFRQKFKDAGVDYDFEYIRGRGSDYTFRPVTKLYYTASASGEEIVFTKVDPSLLLRMIELHKGHGPTLMRWYESIFGVSLILVTLSGLWLAFTVPTYRKTTLISFAIGAAVIAVCLI